MTKRQWHLVQIAMLLLRSIVTEDEKAWDEQYGEKTPTGGEVDDLVVVLSHYVEE